MANIAQPSAPMQQQPAQMAQMAPPPGQAGQPGPPGSGDGQQQQQGEQINLDEMTTDQALNIISQAVRQQPFTYMEHVQLEQARAAVEQAVQGS
tara:strand:- start:2096 stop:2377 length:282 start_codon:yes stop_codon:yes gene_type:complete